MDEDGMDTEYLAELLERLERSGELERLRLIYVCDYFQNPSGRTLSLPRRRRLLELADRYGRRRRLFILEDAAYRRDFRRALWSMVKPPAWGRTLGKQ